MILPDYPIQSNKDDLLKRSSLAQKVADLILTFKGKESFVVGIEGAWGSGKTSFTNLVMEELGDNVIYIPFNPWAFSDEISLLNDFFESFSEALETYTGKKLRGKIKKYGNRLSKANLRVPYIKISTSILNLFFPDKSLRKIREELNKKLSTINKKIVVVIGDIDRLDPEETKMVFKLVKLTADFPKTIFLLEYDRKRIEQRLTEVEKGFEGSEYMKKIVQVSFSLPEPDKQNLRKILFNDLDESIESIYGEIELIGDSKKHWDGVFHNGFGGLFTTIRDIKRYISSLRLNWSIVGKDDVNMVDFMSIEAIRVFAPEFYNDISINKPLFTGTHKLFEGLSVKDDNQTREKKYKELLETIPQNLKENIDGICKELFPQLAFGSTHGPDWQKEWRRDLRICSAEKFNFYFQLGLPEGAVSEVEIKSLLKTLNSEENFSHNILRFNKEGKLRKVLERLLDYLDEITEEQVKILILSLWNLETDIDDQRIAIFDIDDVETQVTRLSYFAIKTANRDRRKNLLENILKKTSTIYYPVIFISLLEDDNKKAIERSEEPIIDKESIEEFKKIAVLKINHLTDTGILKNQKHLNIILFIWKSWESKEKVHEYIKNLVKDKKGLVTFLASFVSMVFSTAGDYNNISKKSIRKLYLIEEIETKVNDISEEELNKMNDKEREAVNLFKNPPKEW